MTTPTLPDLFYTAYFIHDGAICVQEACLPAYDTMTKALEYIDGDTGDLHCILETERVQRSGAMLMFNASERVANHWLRTRSQKTEHEGLYIEMSDFPRFVQEHADVQLMDNIIGEINEEIMSENRGTLGRTI